MQADKTTHKDLIRKYIQQECNAEELDAIRALMLLPGTQQLFDEVLAESWTGLHAEQDIENPALNKKLQLFYERLAAEEELMVAEQSAKEAKVRSIKKRSYLQYAAVLVLCVLGLTTYSILQFKKTPVAELTAMREMVNANGERSKITLPDNSEVYLGAGSKLTFPEKFKAGSREVSLEGEAFFEVTKNPQRPFIIHTRSVQTKVLGTSFRIEAFRNHPLVVSVATGKVRVDDFAGAGVRSLAVLTPGQQVTYANGAAVNASTAVEDVKAWKDGRLVFNKRSMQEITTVLERWYNVKFSYSNEAKAGEQISVVLQASVPLQKIMKVLSATGHFHYKINDKNVSIN